LALRDDIKVSLRATSEMLDAEVDMLVGAALYDMERVGVNPALLAIDEGTQDIANPFVKHAVTAYCKAHAGYDVAEAQRFDDSYRRIVCDLMNSSENIAAMAELPCPCDGEGEDGAGEGGAPEEGGDPEEGSEG